MKLRSAITAGCLLILTCGEVFGAHGPHGDRPPLDRPTPPPCCADGICYPRPQTFGWYERRWRRWPTDVLEPIPADVRPPARAVPGLSPFEAPPAEEEDRRAPLPTTPREEETAPQQMSPPAETPTTTPITRPAEDGSERPEPYERPRTFFDNDENEPTGDLDPPPAPPFAATMSDGERSVVRPVNGGSSAPAQRPVAPARPAAENDPPPALPFTLAGGGAY